MALKIAMIGAGSIGFTRTLMHDIVAVPELADTTFAFTTPYYTHQVLELPPIAIDVTHWVLHQGWCPDCGRWSKAQVPAEHATGYGPRCSALMGELAGAYGNGRRLVQTFCASVWHRGLRKDKRDSSMNTRD